MANPNEKKVDDDEFIKNLDDSSEIQDEDEDEEEKDNDDEDEEEFKESLDTEFPLSGGETEL